MSGAPPDITTPDIGVKLLRIHMENTQSMIHLHQKIILTAWFFLLTIFFTIASQVPLFNVAIVLLAFPLFGLLSLIGQSTHLYHWWFAGFIPQSITAWIVLSTYYGVISFGICYFFIRKIRLKKITSWLMLILLLGINIFLGFLVSRMYTP